MSPLERIHTEYYLARDKEKRQQRQDQQEKIEKINKQFQTWSKTNDARRIKTELTKDLQQAISQHNKTFVEFSPVVYELAKNVKDSDIDCLMNGTNGPYYIKIITVGGTARVISLLNERCADVRKPEVLLLNERYVVNKPARYDRKLRTLN